MSTTLERLTAILTRDYPLATQALMPDTPLATLGIDSLGTVELLWTVEDEFKIKLPAEPVELPTIGDVARYIEEIIASQVPGGSSEITVSTPLANSVVPAP